MERNGNYLSVDLVSSATIDTPYQYTNISLLQSSDIPKDKIVFSFQYFNQIDYFGIGGAKSKWFISIIERLKEISKMTGKEIDVFLSGGRTTHSHQIQWEQAPITRDDLTWIPKHVDKDDIVQLNISTGKGRIIGYLDKCIFYVVLLDEKHNMQSVGTKRGQPSKTIIGESQYDKLLHRYTELSKCINNACSVEDIRKKIAQLEDKENNYIMSCELEEEYYLLFLERNESKGLKDLVEIIAVNDLYNK